MTSTPATPTNSRSDARSKVGVVVDRVLCVMGWAMQASAAALYVVVMLTSPAWHPMPIVPLVLSGLFVALMAALWFLAMYEEQRSFYDRDKSSLFRKAGFLGHATLLCFAAAAAADLPNPQRVGTWLVLGFCAFTAPIIWAAWMHTQYLPPEDQAVIDAIHTRRSQAIAAVYDASEKERRRARLSAIVTSLGYELTDTTAAPKQEETLQTWAVPSRKHSPLVYFIRNGNRLKIGTSTELKRRIRTLALRAENVVLLVNGGQDIERAFHRQFSDLRIGNTEWFAYEGALVDFVTTENHRIREDQVK